jgi:hypothetical protein
VRPTSIIGVIGLVVVGIIIADLVMHPTGTQAAANGAATIIDPTYSALLGNTSTPPGQTTSRIGGT